MIQFSHQTTVRCYGPTVKPFQVILGKPVVYPGSRKPRPLAVDEYANFWPGCRPARALVRCHGLCPWGSTDLNDILKEFHMDSPKNSPRLETRTDRR
jgi:hypothetical protein